MLGIWFAVVILAASVGYGEISSVKISPIQPIDHDRITIRIQGVFYDGCWQPYPETSVQIVGNTIKIYLTFTDVWRPGGVCTMMLVYYDRSFEIGPFSGGNYNVEVYEYHQSLRDPGTNMASATFKVARCGDVDNSGAVNLADAVFLVNYVFDGGQAPNTIRAADGNCDGKINLTDMVFLVRYLFDGGDAPCAACP